MENKEFFEFLNFISTWKPQSDVFALNYYAPFTATSAALCGQAINRHFRKSVKLKGQGFVSSFLPIVVLPAVVGSLCHTIFIVKPLLSQSRKYCSICLELRSGFIALLTGIIYPSLLAPISAFISAERYYTYALPSIYKEPASCIKLAIRLYKPFLPKLGIIAALQMIGGMALLHLEEKNFHTVIEETSKMESYLEETRKNKENLKKWNS